MNHIQELQKKNKRNKAVIIAMLISVVILGIACLFAGSSNMSFSDALAALAKKGTAANNRIIWNVFYHYSTSSNHCPFTDMYTLFNNSASTNP